MQDVAAARARLIDLFTDVGRSLLHEHCGAVPVEALTSIRQSVTVHIFGRPDSDVKALAMFTDDELNALATEFLAEPFRQMAAIFSAVRRESERDGMNN